MVELAMQYIEQIFIVCIVIYGIGLGIVTRIGYTLFNLLRIEHSSYYEKIGQPLMLVPQDMSVGGYVQLLRGTWFVLLLVVRGIPRDFPGDIKMRKIAHRYRLVSILQIVLFVALIGAGYGFLRSVGEV